MSSNKDNGVRTRQQPIDKLFKQSKAGKVRESKKPACEPHVVDDSTSFSSASSKTIRIAPELNCPSIFNVSTVIVSPPNSFVEENLVMNYFDEELDFQETVENFSFQILNEPTENQLFGRKRKGSIKTEAPSPQKLIKTLEVDQLFDTSHISIASSESTIIYDYDSGIKSISGKMTEVVLPKEKRDVLDQTGKSPGPKKNIIDNIIQLADVPLSPRSKCLNWTSIPQPRDDSKKVAKNPSKKTANKPKDVKNPKTNIPKSSHGLLKTPVNKSAKQQATKDQHQQKKIVKKLEIYFTSDSSPSLADNSTSNPNGKLQPDQKQTPVEKQKPPNMNDSLIHPAKSVTNSPTKYRQTTLFERNNNSSQTLKSKENPTTSADRVQKIDKGKQTQTKILKSIKRLFNNFKSVESLRSLLSPEETRLLHKFDAMNENQQYIVIKMYTRKKMWYNEAKFCEMVNIEFTQEIAADFRSLCKKGFFEYFSAEPDNMWENLEQLDLAKVKEIVTDLHISIKKKTKENMIQAILKECRTQGTLSRKTFKDVVMEKISKKFGKAIRIKNNTVQVFDNFCFLAIFASSTFEDVQDYLRFNDTVFPEAVLEDFRVFYTREKFLEYTDAIKLQKELEVIYETSNSGDHKLRALNEVAEQAYDCLNNLDDDSCHANEPHLNRFTASHVYRKLLFSCCEKLAAKKTGFSSQVKKWLEFLIRKFPFSQAQGKWFYKLIGLHMRHLEIISYETAAKLLIEVLATKQSVLGERINYELGVLGRSILKSKKHRIDQIFKDQLDTLIPNLMDINSIPVFRFSSKAIPSNSIGRKRMYTRNCEDGVTISNVETLALMEYNRKDYPSGQHSEGSHIHNLLVLYFWDIIYNLEEDVSNTFISKLQSAPLDIFTEYFYVNRKNTIDKRIKEIERDWTEEKLVEFGISNWEEHSHECSVFGQVQSVLDKEMVRDLVDVIGRKVLAKIFQRLVKNLGQYKSGMPDLLVWNTKTKTHKFVEVKGENDRLAAHQTLWLLYLKEAGASVEICYVDSC